MRTAKVNSIQVVRRTTGKAGGLYLLHTTFPIILHMQGRGSGAGLWINTSIVRHNLVG
jgi:hypothetical protein